MQTVVPEQQSRSVYGLYRPAENFSRGTGTFQSLRGGGFIPPVARCCFPVHRSLGEGGCIAASLLVFTSPMTSHLAFLCQCYRVIGGCPCCSPLSCKVFGQSLQDFTKSLQGFAGSLQGFNAFAHCCFRIAASLLVFTSPILTRSQSSPTSHPFDKTPDSCDCFAWLNLKPIGLRVIQQAQERSRGKDNFKHPYHIQLAIRPTTFVLVNQFPYIRLQFPNGHLVGKIIKVKYVLGPFRNHPMSQKTQQFLGEYLLSGICLQVCETLL